MHALITGATGLIGRALLERLGGGRVLSRDPEAARRRLGEDVEVMGWSPLEGPPPAEAFEDIEVVFHLAGEPVANGRLTPARKARILESRVKGTRHLVEAIEALDEGARPKALISASAIGFYGDRAGGQIEEADGSGGDFLAKVCEAWEREALACAKHGVRVVLARLGIVLSEKGGALPRMMRPFKLGLGGRLGDGEQFMSWIHLDDAVEMLRFAAKNASICGPLNVVAPYPITNAEFTRTLSAALKRPAWFPVPRRLLNLAVGELADVLLASQRVYPMAALDAGFCFNYAIITRALKACILGPQYTRHKRPTPPPNEEERPSPAEEAAEAPAEEKPAETHAEEAAEEKPAEEKPAEEKPAEEEAAEAPAEEKPAETPAEEPPTPPAEEEAP